MSQWFTANSDVDEIVREFNDLGMIVKEYQEHAGAKSSSTLYVGINYDTSVSSGEFTKGLRQTSVRYPNGRLVHSTYGSSGNADDNLNRLQAIKFHLGLASQASTCRPCRDYFD